MAFMDGIGIGTGRFMFGSTTGGGREKSRLVGWSHEQEICTDDAHKAAVLCICKMLYDYRKHNARLASHHSSRYGQAFLAIPPHPPHPSTKPDTQAQTPLPSHRSPQSSIS